MKQTKRIYEAPAMQVVELRTTKLLMASTPDRGIQNMDEDYLFNESES